ncbi:MAG: HsdR family type I site-specific deoxyribonuclease [Gemmataceae bacterium]|nr:HsdR family type I site-specific deoxyribonuclease [Gemmataceae bacterium]
MHNAFNETAFEETTLERLKGIGYDHAFGPDLDRPDKREVVLPDRLRAFLARRHPDLPPASVELAVAAFARPGGPDTLRRNKHFHEAAVQGRDIPVELPGGRREHRHVWPIAWDDPAANDFLAVNQLPVGGYNDRRPDIVVHVNGLPLVLFELKNPWEPKTTAWNAWNQIQHYRNDIPRLFEFNALVVVSDGETTLHGQWRAAWEWYAPRRSIDGETPVPGTVGGMKALVEGLFRKDRLLAYVRDFIVFEEANEKITKKAARYHQFFAARKAADRAVAADAAADKRVGVIWHTTGSGKSLSMLFPVGLLRRRPELNNPTVVIEVDRQDLDDQLGDQFEAGRSLVGAVRWSDSADTLRDLPRNSGGGVILSTIEKFRLKDEAAHPVLSDRANVFVVADEAHRSQYGFGRGFAGNLADALPNAKRIGFTGTPVSLAGADTVGVFGHLIHVYDLTQAQADKATVPIYYTPRQVKLHLTGADVDAALAEITAGLDPDALGRRKGRWAALAAAAGAADRVWTLAADLLARFLDRTATMPGKGMIVCMTRRNGVALYDALEAFQAAEQGLSLVFLLVKHIDACRAHADEVAFYQGVRKKFAKALGSGSPAEGVEAAVRGLLDDTIETGGCSTCSGRSGWTGPTCPCSTTSSWPPSRTGRGRACGNRQLVKMRREMQSDDERAGALNLSPEELAFYDAVATHYAGLYDAGLLRELVFDVVRTLKVNLKADWRGGDRPPVLADLRAAVRRTLRKHHVKAEHLEPLADRVLEQAEYTFAHWPLPAI